VSVRWLIVPTAACVFALGTLACASPDGASAVRQPPMRVSVEPGLESFETTVVRAEPVWASLPGIGSPADVLQDTVHVWVVRDLASLDSVGLARRETWVAGVADPARLRIGLPVGRSDADLRATMRHEVAHLALHATTGGNYPLWLTEGYAQLATGRWGVDDAWRLRFAFAREGGESLRRIRLRFRRGQLDAQVDYMLAYTAVYQLYALGGDAGLRSLFRALDEGSALDAAIRSVYGITEAQFEQAWRRSVTDRYGWLYLVSRASVFWILITLLVAWLSFLRFRRDRRRLDEMREWEATSEAAEIPFDLVFPEWDPDSGSKPGPRGDPP